MADKLMYIPNDDAQNYPLCKLQFTVETFEHKIEKSPKLLSQRMRKRYYKVLGASVKKHPNVSFLPDIHNSYLFSQIFVRFFSLL